jgi:hypothetical protein
LIDVRLTLLTDDGAVIYLSYEGRFMGASDAMAKLAQGATLAVGLGQQTGFNPTYTIFEIG